ncbi:hypothetical protein, partial [Plasmodium yoelii yoelii]
LYQTITLNFIMYLYFIFYLF